MEMAHTQTVSAKTDRSQPKKYCILPLSASDFDYTREIHVQETSDTQDIQTGRNPDLFCESFARHPATKWSFQICNCVLFWDFCGMYKRVNWMIFAEWDNTHNAVLGHETQIQLKSNSIVKLSNLG